MRDVVGVHDGHRVCGVPFRPLLVAKNPEGNNHIFKRAEPSHDSIEKVPMPGYVVRVELNTLHCGRSCVQQGRAFGLKGIASPGGQHHGTSTVTDESLRHGEPNLRTTAENQNSSAHARESA